MPGGVWPQGTWQRLLAEAFNDTATLLRALELEPAACGADLNPDFPLRVPMPFVRRMRRGDAHDPLLRQVLARRLEREVRAGFDTDPLGEADARVAPALLQKYAGRALLITTPACAVHCRYCFRRHFDYSANRPADHDAALAHLAGDPSIREVILSGGDPLVLDDAPLARLLNRLQGITHIATLRLHTRLPIVLPQRVTDALLEMLSAWPGRLVVVVHVNHAREIDADVVQALAALRGTGALLLNQAVLLEGVNRDVDVLCALSERLLDAGVAPYYLHVPDRVRGTAHFEVGEDAARELLAAMRARLPGYLVPRLVREVPGDVAKRPL